MRTLISAIVLLAAASTVAAELITYNFTAGWVTRNPDGLFDRPVMALNGQWPLPTIYATIGDQIVVNLYNDLGNTTCSLHFHGLYMNGTTHMDGVGQATQCPVAVNHTFTYTFNITQPGTYWYHSHVDGQYPDGLRGALIIHDPENPYRDQFDHELVITLSDWYHGIMADLIASFISVTNPTGAEPVPDSALMNDTQELQIQIQPGKTYFVRLINMAAFAPQYFWIEDHTFRIIELDGVYHEPTEASTIYIAPAQRYGFLLTAKNSTTTNFAVNGAMDADLFDTVPASLNPNVTSYLIYNSSAPLPKPVFPDSFDPIDDAQLIPTDREPLFEDPIQTITLDMKMDNLGDGANYAFFNDITYVRPRVPTLYTVLSAGDLVTNTAIYGYNTHSILLSHNQVFELVLNNHDSGKHPFHLHGHAFQVLHRSLDDAGDWNPDLASNGTVTFPAHPARRDTLVVRPYGNFVIRFRSDNPGVWLFHCHIEWHVDSGLILTFIEAPEQLQTQLAGKIPQNHFDNCIAEQMPYQGNAAGNTEDLLDLTGENLSPRPLPAGFTAKGYVALVFSCIAGALGMAAIVWYGLGEMGQRDEKTFEGDVTTILNGESSEDVVPMVVGVEKGINTAHVGEATH